jgi:hypothetical protein
METLTIGLPGEIKAFLEEQAVREGASVGEPIRAILGEARERDLARREIRGKLREAIESGPATPMTRGDWDDIRREVRARRDLREGDGDGGRTS